MAKLTVLRVPTHLRVASTETHPKVFRTDFYELARNSHDFVVAEIRKCMAGNRRDAMLDRVPALRHGLGQGETTAMLDQDSEPFLAAVEKYFDLLRRHSEIEQQLSTHDGDTVSENRIICELIIQVLQCYRLFYQCLTEAYKRRVDIN